MKAVAALALVFGFLLVLWCLAMLVYITLELNFWRLEARRYRRRGGKR